MMNFHQWNSAYHPDRQVPQGFEVWGEVIWDACAAECAKLCREKAKEQIEDESLRVYTCLVLAKALDDLGDSIENH